MRQHIHFSSVPCLSLLGLLAVAPAVFGGPAKPQMAWKDNERQFKSDDPKYTVRRSEHFRILWGKGVGEGNSNADFGRLNVVPQTKGDATDPALLGKTVSVRGCMWVVSGEKRVTWAEVK